MGLFDFLKGKGASPANGTPAAVGAPGGAQAVAAEPDLGCLVCGKVLAYGQATRPMACALCGASRPSTVRCQAGHFVCETCHGGEARDVIERVCATTTERDPVALAVRLMQLPALKLHGPEHHFLVPAVLVATWSNATGGEAGRAERVAEARRRSDELSGGACGTQGACGAAVGAGTFVAIATDATPLDGEARGLANRMTARALSLVGETGGSRCCKRDSLLSILAAARFTREHLKVELPAHGVGCEWSGRNRECLGGGCPFNR